MVSTCTLKTSSFCHNSTVGQNDLIHTVPLLGQLGPALGQRWPHSRLQLNVDRICQQYKPTCQRVRLKLQHPPPNIAHKFYRDGIHPRTYTGAFLSTKLLQVQQSSLHPQRNARDLQQLLAGTCKTSGPKNHGQHNRLSLDGRSITAPSALQVPRVSLAPFVLPAAARLGTSSVTFDAAPLHVMSFTSQIPAYQPQLPSICHSSTSVRTPRVKGMSFSLSAPAAGAAAPPSAAAAATARSAVQTGASMLARVVYAAVSSRSAQLAVCLDPSTGQPIAVTCNAAFCRMFDTTQAEVVQAWDGQMGPSGQRGVAFSRLGGGGLPPVAAPRKCASL